jgi:hypothetical protein
MTFVLTLSEMPALLSTLNTGGNESARSAALGKNQLGFICQT